MWDLNDEPRQERDDRSEGYSSPKTASGEDDKGKRWVVGHSPSNSSSSALVPGDVSDEYDDEVARDGSNPAAGGACQTDEGQSWNGGDGEHHLPTVTRQFFPMDEVEEGVGAGGGGGGFPKAQWLGVRFCQSDPAAAAETATGTASWAGGPSSPQQPQRMPPMMMKKSRRGPRSRSSQYRGVTLYRRTGRWESHIW